eukprot:TRINITY_DN43510_c0_g1_i1.p1 TRINITY_DN43510_c0_g1~~TRINITY_DN43510_c0_g1_i1.p1  ORF type:complete len:192 (-),score=38.70 TRINITY_DN43510_c0_g1_i1:112-687(-)
MPPRRSAVRADAVLKKKPATQQRKPQAAEVQRRPAVSRKAEEEEASSVADGEAGSYELLGMLIFGQGTSSPAFKCSVLGKYRAYEDAGNRAREEADKVIAYTRGAYGSKAADKVSKQTKADTQRLSKITMCLTGAVRRNDHFRWQVVPAAENHETTVFQFWHDCGPKGKKTMVQWVSEDMFSDGLDIWMCV